MKFLKFDVITIAGFVFTGVGALLIAFGLCCLTDPVLLSSAKGDPIMLIVIFIAIGSIVTAIGGVILAVCIRDMLMCKKVFERGEYIVLPISDIRLDTTIHINMNYMYVIEAQYTDPISKNIYLFRSRRLTYNPSNRLITDHVNVYVNPPDYKHYYMDIDDIM